MTRRAVEVTTGSRLHFGLLSFGRTDGQQFGGAGAMIDAPAVRLRIKPADRLVVTGPSAETAHRSAEMFARATGLADALHVAIEVLEAPASHVGLGSGTQLGLAVAAGLNAFCGRPQLDATALAHSVGRGRRSAVGLHGFLHGGLILEAGKRSAEEISPLVNRVPIPAEWRFLLVRQNAAEGLSGTGEQQAFARADATSEATACEMFHEASTQLLPAAAENRFEDFGASLWRYGQAAGQLFSALQGGTYATPQAAELVQTLRNAGVTGVAQSSWGPTIFAVLPNEVAAGEVMAMLQPNVVAKRIVCSIARPLNAGARIELSQDGG